jgi:hypothetical protein
MTRFHRFLVILIFALGLSSRAEAASNLLIVQISPTISIDTLAATLNGAVIDSIPAANTYLLNVSVVPRPAVASQLGIQWMELNAGVTLPRFALCGVSSLPVSGQCGVLSLPPSAAADWYKLQPALQLINAGKALPVSTGRGVVVADVNSQLDYAHPALSGHLTSGYDFISTRPTASALLNQSDAGFLEQSDAGFLEQSDAGFLEQSDAGFLEQSNTAYLDGLNPAYSHGSLSAGLIAAIAPDSMIMPLHAFDDDGRSDLFTLAKAIRYAVDHGAQIINLNFGIVYQSLVVQSAVQFAQTSNVSLVAPAGDDNTSQPQYPAAFSGVIAAAATDLEDTRASFSNYGGYVFGAAPGVGVISVYPRGYYGIASGTSLSAAAVAGTAALVRSLRTNGVSDSIARTSLNIDSRNPAYQNQLGYGRIDAFAAVMSSRAPTTTSINAPAVTYNDSGIVTVTVTSPSATPAGTVVLTVDGTTKSAALSSNSATFTINGLNAGDHTLTASYAAQSFFMASSATGTLHVSPAPTATAVSSVSNPSTFGQAVVLTATVNGTSPSAGIPPGTVTFYDGVTVIGTSTLNASGVATLSASGLAAGAHVVTAAYGATNNFSASTSPAWTQTVNKANSSTILASSLNPSSVGTDVTFTAVVNAVSPGAGTATGTITFTDGNAVLATVAVNGLGQATLLTASLTVDIHSITAVYSGDSNFIASTSAPVSQIIYAYPEARGDGFLPTVPGAGGGATFVIGDLNAVLGKQVTFWGTQWDKLNSLSGSPPPPSFKGYANAISVQPPGPGGAWTSSNGSAAPASIPSYMAVIVSSSITKSGSTISGDVVRMVVVRTDPGYGHVGTGTVLAIISL